MKEYPRAKGKAACLGSSLEEEVLFREEREGVETLLRRRHNGYSTRLELWVRGHLKYEGPAD